MPSSGRADGEEFASEEFGRTGKFEVLTMPEHLEQNFAAWLQDTIMTTPHDISIQIQCWLFNGRHATSRFDVKGGMRVGLSAHGLADAYHGVPNIPAQMNLCVVAMRNLHTGQTEFYISKTHLFGLSAAVVDFNRLRRPRHARLRITTSESSPRRIGRHGSLRIRGINLQPGGKTIQKR